MLKKLKVHAATAKKLYDHTIIVKHLISNLLILKIELFDKF